jgi:S-disulfanyl-L-cysteine oxidoreductase SoxD
MNLLRNRHSLGAQRIAGFAIAALALLVAGLLAAYPGSSLSQVQAAPKTTKDGVYSVDQAKRGKADYSQNCSACHLDDLSGSGQAPPLAGDAFMDGWDGHSIGELLDAVHNTMPLDKPGSLSADDSLDIVTYILQANNFPAGKDDLKNDPDALKNIMISYK